MNLYGTLLNHLSQKNEFQAISFISKQFESVAADPLLHVKPRLHKFYNLKSSPILFKYKMLENLPKS